MQGKPSLRDRKAAKSSHRQISRANQRLSLFSQARIFSRAHTTLSENPVPLHEIADGCSGNGGRQDMDIRGSGGLAFRPPWARRCDFHNSISVSGAPASRVPALDWASPSVRISAPFSFFGELSDSRRRAVATSVDATIEEFTAFPFFLALRLQGFGLALC
jgi:hypothetical protein